MEGEEYWAGLACVKAAVKESMEHQRTWKQLSQCYYERRMAGAKTGDQS